MSNYWQNRFKAVEAMNNQTARNTVQAITPAFDQAQAQIEKEINVWYARFAKNNQITMQEAKKLLNSKELKEFRWDVEEYIKYGRQNAIDQQWMKQLENASARFHISRLEALKIRTQNAAERAFGNELDQLDQMAARMYMDGYYHTAYEIQRGLGIGFDVSKIDQRKLDNIISKPWTTDNKTFKDRIWTQKSSMISELHNQMTRMCILGKSPDEAIREMEKFLDKEVQNKKMAAGRLVMTESAYFASAAQKDCFNDLGVEKYEIVATLDSHTSDICQNWDGQIVDMKDFQAGVTAPPFHVWCRSCTCPWFPDNDDGQRAARDPETGETYYVPADMKYGDWKKSFVDKTKDPADWLRPATDEEIRKAIQLMPDMFPPSFTATKAEAKNTQALMDYVNACEDANPDVIELYSKMGKMENIESAGIPWEIKHGEHSGVVKYWEKIYNGQLAKAHIAYPKLTGDNFIGQVQTTLHEQMHLMDMYLRKDPLYGDKWFSSGQKELLKFFSDQADPTIIKKLDDFKMSDEVKKLFADFDEEYTAIGDRLYKSYKDTVSELKDKWKTNEISYSEYNKLSKKAWKEYNDQSNYQRRNAMGGGIGNLQDIYDAISGGRFRDVTYNHIRYGHGSSYYRSMANRCEESLANYGALSITRPDLIELLRKDYPELVDGLEKTVQRMLDEVGD